MGASAAASARSAACWSVSAEAGSRHGKFGEARNQTVALVDAERHAHDPMPPRDQLPGRLERLRLQRGIPVQGGLDDVDAIAGKPQVIENHAPLSR